MRGRRSQGKLSQHAHTHTHTHIHKHTHLHTHIHTHTYTHIHTRDANHHRCVVCVCLVLRVARDSAPHVHAHTQSPPLTHTEETIISKLLAFVDSSNATNYAKRLLILQTIEFHSTLQIFGDEPISKSMQNPRKRIQTVGNHRLSQIAFFTTTLDAKSHMP